MASEIFGRANDEFINENYSMAVELYTEALDIDKTRDDILANRAQAYIKLEQYKEAVEDATDAVNINPKNTKGHLRKGVALFYLEDFPTAKEAFTEGQALDHADASFKTWIRKCEAEMDLAQMTEPDIKVGVSETSKDAAEQSSNPTQTSGSNTPSVPVGKTTMRDSSSSGQNQPNIAIPSKPKSRYDWYQTQTHVVVTILLKNVQQEDMNINIEDKSLSATIKLPSGSDYSLELDLSHPIDSKQSLTKLMKSKIEIKLKKVEGIHWQKLEGEEPSKIKQIQNIDTTESVMAYPSSSHYTRNWDQLAKEVSEEEKEEKKEGDAALNDLFQQIYADGTDETKKAMMKSFYESGGTVLSTNWNEIGTKKTDVKPPDGMEYKKWNS